ncbi:hypothetical protein GCWU000341_02565 [Oribacterium sp. oral taxon 078 str. F0262]|nr:hypothetical protein GCWU000341_02565 [Oribacterium sp. oral taxon 078 str. F0262]
MLIFPAPEKWVRNEELIRKKGGAGPACSSLEYAKSARGKGLLCVTHTEATRKDHLFFLLCHALLLFLFAAGPGHKTIRSKIPAD